MDSERISDVKISISLSIYSQLSAVKLLDQTEQPC